VGNRKLLIQLHWCSPAGTAIKDIYY